MIFLIGIEKTHGIPLTNSGFIGFYVEVIVDPMNDSNQVIRSTDGK